VTAPGLAAGLIWLVVYLYALAGSVDFGATFWRMLFRLRGQEEAARVADRYVSPLWEATNIFLVLIAVALVGFFPGAAYVFGTVLLGPASLILILLALRGAALGYGYVLRSRAVDAVAGVTAVLLPATLVLVLPISAGGFVRVTAGGVPELDAGALLRSPVTYVYLTFGLTAGMYISATFLADYAHAAGRRIATAAYRRIALWAGPLAIAAGAAAIYGVPPEPWLQPRLAAQWPWFGASLLAFLAAMLAQVRGSTRLAVLATGLQFGLAQAGYGLAHAPYLLFPLAPTAASFTGPEMFAAVVAVVVAGMALLTPAFVWLWRLFVVDRRYTRV
jgi:cytochrome d ubiquinol oxidase subunit II